VALERLQIPWRSLRNIKAEITVDGQSFEEALQKTQEAFWNALWAMTSIPLKQSQVLFEWNRQVNQWLASDQLKSQLGVTVSCLLMQIGQKS
jgi:hypothetical protein